MTHANNNLNFVETESSLSRHVVNDADYQTAEVHSVSSLSPYSSSKAAERFGQQPLNLLSNNSASDPVLSTSTLISITDNAHQILTLTENETAQCCINDTLLAECQAVVDNVHSSSSFYLSPTANLSSSSSSSSDNDVSNLLSNICICNNFIYKNNLLL